MIHPLKIWREGRGLSQAALGTGIGRSDMAVSRYEKWILPDRDALERILAFTGGAITPNDWFDIPAIVARTKARTVNNGKKVKTGGVQAPRHTQGAKGRRTVRRRERRKAQ